jgi:predicted ribosome quality control (RQC) complex YloA/Tae2 family protein
MHADMYGSASTVIKNFDGSPIPDSTLMQAGIATLCRSKAWESKIVVSAWWVYSN